MRGQFYAVPVLFILLGLALASCSPTPTPRTASPGAATPTLPIATVLASATPYLSPTPTATAQPAWSARTAEPTPTLSDLDQYFSPFVGWKRHLPHWTFEPPEDRQVVLVDPGPWDKREFHLLDAQGNLLAAFTTADGKGFPPGEILWSHSKALAVVEFSGADGTGTSFFIIDRDGKPRSDLRFSYWGPVWSPTQDLLAYHGYDDRLYVADGNGAVLVSSESFSERPCVVCSVPPQWSPDGNAVALVTSIGNVARTTAEPLCLFDLDGELFCVPVLDYRPSDMHWLDNQHILLDSEGWKKDNRGQLLTLHRYYVLNVETKAIREVFDSANLTPTAQVPP